jgi:hypothetical protein
MPKAASRKIYKTRACQTYAQFGDSTRLQQPSAPATGAHALERSLLSRQRPGSLPIFKEFKTSTPSSLFAQQDVFLGTGAARSMITSMQSFAMPAAFSVSA